MFDKNRYLQHLTTEKLGRSIEVLCEVSSTNSYLMEKVSNCGDVVVAENQTSGKGRTGRCWFTFADSLAFSLNLGTMDSANLLPLNIIAGYSVIDALRTYADASLKWPNDCMLGGKKVGGILLEVKFRGNNVEKVILGIGINLSAEETPISIKNISTTLALHTEKTIFKDILLANILNSLESKLNHFKNERFSLNSEWERYSANLNREISFHKNGEKILAYEIGITNLGELIVKMSDGKFEFVNFGDITCS